MFVLFQRGYGHLAPLFLGHGGASGHSGTELITWWQAESTERVAGKRDRKGSGAGHLAKTQSKMAYTLPLGTAPLKAPLVQTHGPPSPLVDLAPIPCSSAASRVTCSQQSNPCGYEVPNHSIIPSLPGSPFRKKQADMLVGTEVDRHRTWQSVT